MIGRGNKKSAVVWAPHPKEVWVCAEVVEDLKDSKKIKVAIDKIQVELARESCIPIHETKVLIETGNDLISLSEVNDATILNCARLRFQAKLIYTSMGTVLMALNPFEFIPNLYTEERVQEYRVLKEEQTAHVYQIPSRAYDALCTYNHNQSILISGESGSGKTQSTKQCLYFLTRVSSESAQDTAATDIANRIVASSPILEAFGNAQTIRNPNSSRFGKWMELNFTDDNIIVGSRITSYLLEKSRVTQRDAKERNYHIFYQLLSCGDASLLNRLSLTSSVSDYKYLSNRIHKDDVSIGNETREAFKQMLFESNEIETIYSVLASVLHLGNIEFDPMDQGESSKISENALSTASLNHIAKLLQISNISLSMALCCRTFQSGGFRKSITTIKLNTTKANEAKDSLARILYDKLFSYIITRINDNNAVASSGKYIGLLDIFGFEIFEVNSFEQLCINYCNEMLQQHFNSVIFIAETKLYDDENIKCDHIIFKDNIDIITDIENSFFLLDEEVKIPRGTSKTWFDKMKRSNTSNTIAYSPYRDEFTVTHYAGAVNYDPLLFMEKNSETLSNDLAQVMMHSEHPIIRALFQPQESENSVTDSPGMRRKTSKTTNTTSLSKNFQLQLKSLMLMLQTTQSHFIRCIKTNEDCKAGIFDASLVHRQLIYSGVFEVVKIQQSGLPSRFSHADFYNRYYCILHTVPGFQLRMPPTEYVMLLRQAFDELSYIQAGRTMVFMKGSEYRKLEYQRAHILEINSNKLKEWLKRRCMTRLLNLIRGFIADINVDIGATAFDAAEQKYKSLQEFYNRFAKLGHSTSMFFHISLLLVHIERSKKIHSILSQLHNITSQPASIENMGAMAKLLDEIAPYELSNNTITTAQGMLKKYQQAQYYLAELEKSNDLTSQQLVAAMTVLQEHEHLLPQASACIAQASTRYEQIKQEYVKYIPNLIEALQKDVASVTSAANLSQVLSTFDLSSLRSVECKEFYKCCSLYTLATRAMADSKFTEVEGIIEEFESICTIDNYDDDSIIAPSFKLLQERFALFKLTIQEIRLRDQLNNDICTGGISSNIRAGERPVVDAMQVHIAAAKALNSAKLASLLGVAEYMCQLRLLFLNAQWKDLELHVQRSPPLEEFNSCRIELESCKLHIQYHDMISKLKQLCGMEIFGKVSLAQGDYSILNISIADHGDIIKKARQIKIDDEKYLGMLDLADKSIKLRRLIIYRDISQSKELVKNLSDHPALQYVLSYRNELAIATAIIQVFDYEGQLSYELSNNVIDWNEVLNESYTCNVSNLFGVVNSILRLTKVPIALIAKAKSARYVLQAREVCHFVISGQNYSSVMGSVYTLNDLSIAWYDQQISYFEQFDMASLPPNAVEIEILLCLLRKLRCEALAELVLKQSCVSGSVGNIIVHDHVVENTTFYNQCAESITELRKCMNKMTIPSKNDVMLRFLLRVDDLSEVAQAMMQLRSQVVSGNWDLNVSDVVKNCPILQAECSLIVNEARHRRYIDMMMLAIEELQVPLLPETNYLDASRVDVTPFQAVLDEVQDYCFNDESKKYRHVLSTILEYLSHIKKGQPELVSLPTLTSIIAENNHLNLSGMISVEQYIKAFQIVMQLFRTCKSNSNKQLLVAIHKSHKICSDNSQIMKWINAAEKLYSLRMLQAEGDLTCIVDFCTDMYQTIQIHAATQMEREFLSYLHEQHDTIKKQSLLAILSNYRDMVTSLGKTGTKGSTGYTTPKYGIQVVEHLISLMQDDEYPEAAAIREECVNILKLRENIYQESKLTNQHSILRRTSSTGWSQQQSETGEELQHLRAVTKDMLTTRIAATVQDEYGLIQKRGYLTELLDDLESKSMIPVFLWSEDGHVELNEAGVKEQAVVLQLMGKEFPEVVNELPLPKVINELHGLYTTVQNTQDYALLEDSLKTFSSFLQVADISHKLKESLKLQIVVFQRGRVLEELVMLSNEGCYLLEILCYERQKFDEYLGKMNYMINFVGDMVIPPATMGCMNCLKYSRDLCWAVELLMNSEIDRFKKLLMSAAQEVPTWFYDKLERWINSLPIPKPIQPSIASASTTTSLVAATVKLPKVEFNVVGVHTIISSIIVANNPALQKQFSKYLHRVSLLNTLWRGIFCFIEDWTTASDSISFMLRYLPSYHIDRACLARIVSVLKNTVHHENHWGLKNIVSDISKTFENIADAQLDTHDAIETCRHTVDILYALDTTLAYMQSAIFSYRIGYVDDGKYYLLRSRVVTAKLVSFTVMDVVEDWSISVSGHPWVLKRVCGNHTTLTEVLTTLSKAGHVSRVGCRDSQSNYYLVTSSTTSLVHIQILDVYANTAMSIQCHSYVYYSLLTSRTMTKALAQAMNQLQMHWAQWMEPETAYDVQRILSEDNPGNASTSLHELLVSSRDTVRSNMKVLAFREQLLCLTQSCIDMDEYNPWALSWMKCGYIQGTILTGNDWNNKYFGLIIQILQTICANCSHASEHMYDDILEFTSYELPRLVYTDAHSSLGHGLYYKGVDTVVQTSYDDYLFAFALIRNCFGRMQYSSRVKPMILKVLQQVESALHVCLQPVAALHSNPTTNIVLNLSELLEHVKIVVEYVSQEAIAPELSNWVKLVYDIYNLIQVTHHCADAGPIIDYVKHFVHSMKVCDASLMNAFSNIVVSYANQMLVHMITTKNMHVLANSHIIALPYESLDAAQSQFNICGYTPNLSEEWMNYIKQEIEVMMEVMNQRTITLESNGLATHRTQISHSQRRRLSLLQQRALPTVAEYAAAVTNPILRYQMFKELAIVAYRAVATEAEENVLQLTSLLTTHDCDIHSLAVAIQTLRQSLVKHVVWNIDKSFSSVIDTQMSHMNTCIDIVHKLCDNIISSTNSLNAQEQHRLISDLMSSAHELPTLDNANITTQTVISTFARRMESIGFVKYYFSRMLENINNDIMLCIDYKLSAVFDEKDSKVCLRKTSSPSLTPFLDDGTSTDDTLSITGLYEYFTEFQLLHNSYVTLKMKYYEENDRLTIEYGAKFCDQMAKYHERFEHVASKEDAAVTAFLHMPEWIVPPSKLVEACNYMRDDARKCSENSLVSEFHKSLMTALNNAPTYDSELNPSFVDDLTVAMMLPHVSAEFVMPADTLELLSRGKLVLQMRKAVLFNIWSARDLAMHAPHDAEELRCVQDLIGDWFESIPEPYSNVGSAEVAHITTLLQNRIIKESLQNMLFTPENCTGMTTGDWKILKKSAVVDASMLKSVFDVAYKSRRFLPDESTMLGLLSAEIMLDIDIGAKHDCMLKMRSYEDGLREVLMTSPLQEIYQQCDHDCKIFDVLCQCMDELASHGYDIIPSNHDHPHERHKSKHMDIQLLEQFLDVVVADATFNKNSLWLQYDNDIWKDSFGSQSASYMISFLRFHVASHRRNHLIKNQLATFDACCEASVATPIAATHEPSTLLEGLRTMLLPFVNMASIIKDEALMRCNNDLKSMNNLITLLKWAAEEQIANITSEKIIDRINILLQHPVPIPLRQRLELLRDTHLTSRIVHSIMLAVQRLEDVRASKRQQLYLDIASIHQSLSYQKTLLSMHNLDYLCDSHLSKIALCNWCMDYLMLILTENWTAMTDAAIEITTSSLYSEFQDILARYISMGKEIQEHTNVIDTLEETLCFHVRRDSIVDISFASLDEEKSEPYFYFIQFDRLKEAIEKASNIDVMQSLELRQRIEIAQFLVSLHDAIESDHWFDEGAQKQVSVATLLSRHKPEMFPRHIALEIQRVDREFQNHQVEIRLVNALQQGKDYLRSGNFKDISTRELEEVVDMASGVRQRNLRTSQLVDTAQKVLSLRRSIKVADWNGIRCWIAEANELAPEALDEINAIRRMSESNIMMHKELNNAMKLNRIGGSYMRLNTENTNVLALVAALRVASHATKLSNEDKQIVYSAESLKSIRTSLLSTDYTSLVYEVRSLDLRRISSCALDEVLLVKRSIAFYETLKRVSGHLVTGRAKGTVGSLDTANVHLYELEMSLHSVDVAMCMQPVKFFVETAIMIKAMKNGKWGVDEIISSLSKRAENDFKSNTYSYLSNMTSGLDHYGLSIKRVDYDKEILGGCIAQQYVANQIIVDNKKPAVTLRRSASQLEVAPIRDIPHRLIYFTESIKDTAISGTVAFLLSNIPSNVLLETEEEILQIRDELYHLIIVQLLQKALRKGQSVHALDIAILIVRHLGVLSQQCWRLFKTALIMRDVRQYYLERDGAKLMEILNDIRLLKSNELLAKEAAEEVEDIYTMICNTTIKRELSHALTIMLPLENDEVPEVSDPVACLRKAIRSTQTADVISAKYDICITTMIELGSATLRFLSAIKSCVQDNVRDAHDALSSLLSRLQAHEGLDWLQPRLRRFLNKMRQDMLSQTHVRSASVLLLRQLHNLPPACAAVSAEDDTQVSALIKGVLDAHERNHYVAPGTEYYINVRKSGNFKRLLEKVYWSPQRNVAQRVTCAIMLCYLMDDTRLQRSLSRSPSRAVAGKEETPMVLISNRVLQMAADMLEIVSQAPVPSAIPKQYSIIATPVFHGATLQPTHVENVTTSWKGHSKFLLMLGEFLQRTLLSFTQSQMESLYKCFKDIAVSIDVLPSDAQSKIIQFALQKTQNVLSSLQT